MRISILQKFLETDTGLNLLSAYKRAVNILRIEEKKDKRKWSFFLLEMYAAIHMKQADRFEEAMSGLMKLYRANYKYEIPEYKLIAIFPLGLLQLARHYGMDVSIEHALIPKDLLVPVSQPCA